MINGQQRPVFYFGLDLGQQQDLTALAVLRRVTDGGQLREYQLQYLKRFERMTAYMDIAQAVNALQDAPRLAGADTYVIADATGVGRPVTEMLKQAGVRNLYALTITGGNEPSINGKEMHVPKRDLVSSMQVLAQNRKIVAAEGLTDWPILKSELQNFKAIINITTGHDTYETWRERDHDDLVLSVAMALWFGENRRATHVFAASKSIVRKAGLLQYERDSRGRIKIF